MIWYKHLYVGDLVKGRKDRIIERIESDRTQTGQYLITISENPAEMLDIFSTVFLTEKRKERLPMVVGLAGTRDEAIFLVRKMTEDCLRATGDVDLRTYFQEEEKRLP
ncbi:MAG: hypothetical protein VZR02_05815 [Lachnospiraceae bacterium]|nr:hypothetical protein [Lachnospiraceae bacterium]